MLISFKYKRRIYTLEAETITLDINGQSVNCCFPIGIKSEWVLCFGKHHSPLFYADDKTPVLAKYKNDKGRIVYSQVFFDTEIKQIVVDFILKTLSGSKRLYSLMEIVSVRRADAVMLIK